jgi:DNA-binding transcriptional MocR family regulator
MGVNRYIVTMTISPWIPDLAGRNGPRYLAIADAIAGEVAAGRLRAGARLPTHRDLAERLDVTVGTVSRAYAEAARRGLLAGEVGRGTFVRSGSSDAAASSRDREGVLDLALNHPPLLASEPPRLGLRRALQELSARPDLGSLFDYPADGGNPGDREAGAAWVRRAGIDARSEHVLVCSGSQHALTTVLATLFRPGDLVLTEALTYPGMKAAAHLLSLRLQGLPLDAHGLRPDAFDAACRGGGAKGLYCVPTIQNPTASVMPESRRAEIAAIARSHDVQVIEDDIHALLPAERPRPLAAYAPERSCYITSTSKTLAPGLRIGYLLGPPELTGRLAASIRATTWSASPLTAEVVSAWIRDGTADAILEERRDEAAGRQALARAALADQTFEAHPFGPHVWLHLPEPWRSESFAAELRRRGVAVTPAEAFAVGRAGVPHAVRLSLGGPRSRADLERALDIVRRTLDAPDSVFEVV